MQSDGNIKADIQIIDLSYKQYNVEANSVFLRDDTERFIRKNDFKLVRDGQEEKRTSAPGRQLTLIKLYGLYLFH